MLVSTLIKFKKFILIPKKVKKPSCFKLYTHLRYFLEGDRPSQTTKLKSIKSKNILFYFIINTAKVVFHLRYRSPTCLYKQ